MPLPPEGRSHAFLAGGGEMAAVIGAHDWSATPLGPIDRWAPTLQTAVAIILRSNLPMVLLWQEEGTMIYNDGYKIIAGARHPATLGVGAREGWPEIADFNDHVLKTVLAGGTLSYKNQHMVVERNGAPENAWFDLDYSPVTGPDSRPAAALAVVTETTTRIDAEQRLRIAQEAGGVGSFEWYPAKGVLDVSDEFRRIWGLPPDTTVTDRMLIDMIEPVDRLLTGPSRLKLPNPLQYAEYRIRRALDSALRWVARRGVVMPASGSGPDRFLGVVIDITERKEVEDALRQSEARWRGLFEQMQEGFFLGELVRDGAGQAADFRFLELNPAFEQQTGLPWASVAGRLLSDVIPDGGSVLLENCAQVVAATAPMAFELQLAPLGQRWFEAHVRPDGKERFAVLFLEITARKAAEAALAESEALFRSLAQSLPSHAWMATPDGALYWFNERIIQYGGKPASELAGDGWTGLVHPDDLPRTRERWQVALAEGGPYQTVFRLRRQDGSYRWHLARAVPSRDEDGTIRRWVGTNTDIEVQKAATVAMARLAETLEERVAERTAELTRAHEALRQSQKMEAVGQLTGGIAHDFNNLLQGIVGSLDIVQKRIAQGRVHEVGKFLAGAMSSADRAAALTHRLLAFSRRQPLDPRPVCANPLLSSMEELLRRTIGEAIRLEIVPSDGLWSTLCDPNQLESSILNLVINARDAMPEGGTLTIGTCNVHLDDAQAAQVQDVRPGQYVCIAVSDTGVGMARDVIERAFDPFFTTKPIGRGTGLGLSMIYGFARQSEGHARIHSEVGRGTTVRLYLPRHHAGAGEPEETLPAATAEAAPDRGTVLVVEDDATVRTLVVELLEELGYRTLEAADGIAGLQVLQSDQRIDLLVTDIGLPGLNGRQVADGGRATRPDLKVLFMTGYAENAAVSGGFLEPGMAMITKPFPMEILASRVRMILASPGNDPA